MQFLVFFLSELNLNLRIMTTGQGADMHDFIHIQLNPEPSLDGSSLTS